MNEFNGEKKTGMERIGEEMNEKREKGGKFN